MTVQDKLISIYFRKCYLGMGEVTQEEQDYLDNNEFICVVTDKTKNNGYQGNQDYIKKYLNVNVEYTLESMNVSQSSSSLKLKEVPGAQFNTVNFEIGIRVNERVSVYLSLSNINFECPYCAKSYSDDDDKYLNRCNKNSSGYTRIKCDCKNIFGMAYDIKCQAVSFKL